LVRTRSQLWPRDEPSARTRGARGDADRRPLDLAALRSLSAEALVRILDELTPAELRKLCTRQNKEDTCVLGWARWGAQRAGRTLPSLYVAATWIDTSRA
jgi:hypothetical protein